MNRTTFEAMGTTVAVHTDNPGPTIAAFAAYEQRFSRFIESSELSRVNASGHTSVPVSSDMSDLLAHAERMRDRTEGLVDPAVGAAVAAWGYDATFSEITDLASAPTPHPVPTWRLESRTLRRVRGTILDLGGIAKGWACDRVVEAGLATVASAGGDLRSADPSLVVEIDDHLGQRTVDVEVGVGALATSSIAQRAWRVADREVSHIVDPRTGSPVRTPVTSASVVADTAVEAEAGAKAVLIRGEDGLSWADRQPWIRFAVALWHDGNVYGTVPGRAA